MFSNIKHYGLIALLFTGFTTLPVLAETPHPHQADVQGETLPPIPLPSDHQHPETAPDPQPFLPAETPAIPLEPITLEENSRQRELIMTNMRRDGSGTSWMPTDNPMQMLMGDVGPWVTMLHWSAFLDYDNQGGPRGDEGIYSQNWGMVSAARPVGNRGVLQLRGMMSLEPLTVGDRGYPSLFQTGETYRGEPLIDRQHPHDLFMELSAQYWHWLGKDTWARFYVAPVGEPALGPVAFPHRYSALLNPESPLSHHMQDSTHIAFGVLTAGLVHRKWQLEASLFNGREPDENRYDFDFGPLTSYSGRLSYLLNPNWSMQVSHGFLDDPEPLEPGDMNRTTASIQHIKMLNEGWWASTLSFGHNARNGPDEIGAFLESTWNFIRRNYVFGRLEYTRKHGLLDIAHNGLAANHHGNDESYNIGLLSLGGGSGSVSDQGHPIDLGGDDQYVRKIQRIRQRLWRLSGIVSRFSPYQCPVHAGSKPTSYSSTGDFTLD